LRTDRSKIRRSHIAIVRGVWVVKESANRKAVKDAVRKSLKGMKITRLDHLVNKIATLHINKGGTAKTVARDLKWDASSMLCKQ
jgi:hypothetical protein